MKRTIYIGSRLQKGTVRVMGLEVDPELPPGCVGVMFAYESAEAATAEGQSVLITAEYDTPQPAKSKPRKRKGGAK